MKQMQRKKEKLIEKSRKTTSKFKYKRKQVLHILILAKICIKIIKTDP